MPVFCNDFLLQGAGIHTDADRDLAHPGGRDNLTDPLGTAYIARIDADFIRTVFNSCYSQSVIKMNIRHERDMDALFDLTDCPCGFLRRNRGADDVAARSFKLQDLGHSSLHIFRSGVGH